MTTWGRFGPQWIFADRSGAVLLLWFVVSMVVCLCMYVLVGFLFSMVVWHFWGKKLSIRFSACSVLVVAPLPKVSPSFPLVSSTEGVGDCINS